MSEFPWKPLRICLDLDRHISEAFQELIHRPRGTTSQSALSQPEIDVYDTDDSYIIDADVPGVSNDDLEVSVREHTGTISGSRGATGIGQTAQGLRIERRQGLSQGDSFWTTQSTPDPLKGVSTCGRQTMSAKQHHCLLACQLATFPMPGAATVELLNGCKKWWRF